MKALESMIFKDGLVVVDGNTNVLEGKAECWKEVIGKNELKINSIFGRKRNRSRVKVQK